MSRPEKGNRVGHALPPAVVHVVPPYVRLPAPGYGGIERIVVELQQAQRAIYGRTPTLLAAADSRSPNTLGVVPSLSARRQVPSRTKMLRLLRAHYEWAVAQLGNYDVAHVHGMWCLPAYDESTAPIVLSVYTDTSDPEVRRSLLSLPAHVHPVANSDSTMRKAPEVHWRRSSTRG